MPKILALDFGLKRTGVAITDDSQIFAFGLTTVDSKDLMSYLTVLIAKESICSIILGEPKRLDSSDTHITQNVYLFKEALEKAFSNVQIILHDERFTSKMASAALHTTGANKKQMKSKELLDQVSATIILQSYLTMQGN